MDLFFLFYSRTVTHNLHILSVLHHEQTKISFLFSFYYISSQESQSILSELDSEIASTDTQTSSLTSFTFYEALTHDDNLSTLSNKDCLSLLPNKTLLTAICALIPLAFTTHVSTNFCPGRLSLSRLRFSLQLSF